MLRTIMVVDDSATIRQVVGTALAGAGYEVIEACDGQDALSRLMGQKVHLVISDSTCRTWTASASYRL